MKRRTWKLVALALGLVLALAACSTGGPTQTPGQSEDGVELTWQVMSDVTALDPAFAYDGPTMAVMLQVTEGLLTLTPEGEIIPCLAESWEASDPTTYVYNLRQDVTFSDGNAMTMDDVLYSLERYRDPEVASYLSWMYDNVESIQQTGDWQITVKLKEADACFKYVFATAAGHVVEKKYCEEKGADFGKPNGLIVGTGPYVVDQWNVGSSVVLVKNDKYWDKNYSDLKVSKVTYNVISEDTTRAAAMTSGQSDIDTILPGDLYDQFAGSDKMHVVLKPSNDFLFLSMNCEKEPFTDVNVRRALACAVDKQSIHDNIIKESGTVANSLPMTESLFTFEKESWQEYAETAQDYKYDMDKAREYLAASAYPDGFEADLMVSEQSQMNAVALTIQQSLAELGITVNIQKVSNDELIAMEFGGVMEGGIRAYDMALFQWEADWPDPSGNTMGVFNSAYMGEGGTNIPSYSNPQVDELLNKQASITDEKERTELLQQALDIIIDESPLVPISYTNYMIGLSNRIEQFDMITWVSFIKDLKLK